MYTRLVIALDGSEPAEKVFSYARFFAQALDIPVELLKPIDANMILTLPDRRGRQSVKLVLAEKDRRSMDYLCMVTRSFDPVGAKCIADLENPGNVVIETAADDGGTIIGVCTYSHSTIHRWLFRSGWEDLRGASRHLLFIRFSQNNAALQNTLPKRVVVPLDGSDLAEKVLPHVAHLAKKMRLDVILMRVLAPPVSFVSAGYWPDMGTFTSLLEPEVHYLAKKVNQLKEQGVSNVSSVVLYGYIPGEIIRTAAKNPHSLIVMSMHGRFGVRRWFGITERIACYSAAPVLVIRFPDVA
jgi:nucleotide-binding universal stress UspA family protein